MADTRIKLKKATAVLRSDHQLVKKLLSEFEKLDEGDEGRMEELFEQVKKELTVHARIEEEVFYPAVEKAQDEEADELVREAHEEHRLVKQLLEELGAIGARDDQFRAKMKVLKENVLHHAEEEQEEIFPLFDSLEKAEQDRVSEELSDRKRELMAEGE